MITSKDNERLKLVRKLHDKSWRDKLGLFFVEGEDAIEAATARAGRPAARRRGRRPEAAGGGRVRAASAARDRRLPARGSAGVGGASGDARALEARRPRQRRDADPHRRRVRRRRRPLGRLRRSDVAESPPRERGLDLARAARCVGRRRSGRGSRWKRTPASRSARSTSRPVSRSCSARSAKGLPAEVERDVDAWIPIAGAESLNVAASGAIALYEWKRQRAND